MREYPRRRDHVHDRPSDPGKAKGFAGSRAHPANMTFKSIIFPSIVALVALASSACVAAHPSTLLPSPPPRDWDATLSGARALADQGQGSMADSVLAQYAASYPNGPLVIEVQYWRALLNLEG